MRILVVGGSGLIGAHVVDVLRERGHAVTTVARTARAGATGLLVHFDHDCFHQPWEEPWDMDWSWPVAVTGFIG